jgi:transcriptional regulator with XRE-family HTH domain
MIDKNSFGKKLAELRTKCGLSQNKLAEMLCVSKSVAV